MNVADLWKRNLWNKVTTVEVGARGLEYRQG